MQTPVTTRDSALAATFFTLGHTERQTDPCMWSSENGKPAGIFYFPLGQPADLPLDAITEAWGGPRAETAQMEKRDDDFVSGILAFIPEEHRDDARKLIRKSQVNFTRLFRENYKFHTMPLLNRSRDEQGISIERRGRSVLWAGKKAPETGISDMKEKAGYGS